MKVVQEILGHSSYMITADTYTHVLPAQQPEAMKHWDKEFHGDAQKDKHTWSDDQEGDDPPGVGAKR